jgi:hypothetical protein
MLLRMFEVSVEKRGRARWEWRVCDSAGRLIMSGWEDSRGEAKYRGDRALFQLLLSQPRLGESPPD